MLLKIIFLLVIAKIGLSMPARDDKPEPRRIGALINALRPPCRGRSPQGRTFHQWTFQYVDVHYNYNTNVNCNDGGGNKPTGGTVLGGNHPGGGLFGGNGPLSFVQTQVQNLLVNGQGLGSLLPQGGIFDSLGSLWPQNGFFNGQGISSLFENGLFSNIFNRPSNSPSVTTTTLKPDVQDPDDIIYNDEKPVHEDHDDVVPDQLTRPGQYLVASNPIFGDFVQDVSDFNPTKALRQINREFNRLVRPLARLFRR